MTSDVDLADVVAFHAWYECVQEVWEDAWPGDPPWADEEAMRELFGDPDGDSQRVLFVGHTPSGEPAGAAEVRMPRRDNRHVAGIDVSVRPSLRGIGVGRALLERAVACAADHGRSVLLASTSGRQASLEARDARFAVAAGFTHARTEVRRELRLPVASGRLEALERSNAGAAEGYELVSWWRHCPEELLESRARLATTLTADEPRGDLDVETEQFDGTRVRRWERDLERVGRELVCTGAVKAGTKELAAVTEIGLPRPGEDLAIQFATVVAGEHRGHRLGILVKVANLRLVEGLATPPRRICTWNAESNEHMIRVNEELGFEIAGRAFNWQRVGR